MDPHANDDDNDDNDDDDNDDNDNDDNDDDDDDDDADTLGGWIIVRSEFQFRRGQKLRKKLFPACKNTYIQG